MMVVAVPSELCRPTLQYISYWVLDFLNKSFVVLPTVGVGIDLLISNGMTSGYSIALCLSSKFLDFLNKTFVVLSSVRVGIDLQ